MKECISFTEVSWILILISPAIGTYCMYKETSSFRQGSWNSRSFINTDPKMLQPRPITTTDDTHNTSQKIAIYKLSSGHRHGSHAVTWQTPHDLSCSRGNPTTTRQSIRLRLPDPSQAKKQSTPASLPNENCRAGKERGSCSHLIPKGNDFLPKAQVQDDPS